MTSLLYCFRYWDLDTDWSWINIYSAYRAEPNNKFREKNEQLFNQTWRIQILLSIFDHNCFQRMKTKSYGWNAEVHSFEIRTNQFLYTNGWFRFQFGFILFILWRWFISPAALCHHKKVSGWCSMIIRFRNGWFRTDRAKSKRTQEFAEIVLVCIAIWCAQKTSLWHSSTI